MIVRKAHFSEIENRAGLPVFALIGEDNEGKKGTGGLTWMGGRCWIWLEIDPAYHPPAVVVWRYAKKALAYARAIGETDVFAARDARFMTSERLLSRLGFERTGEIIDGSEVWACRV